MFANIDYPEHIKPETLDRYLEHGWFRMNQSIFTTNFLHFHNEFYSAIWLRVCTHNYIADKKEKAICKTNQHFRTEIVPAHITDAQENLYDLYKEGISFQPASSLHQLLIANNNYNRYNSFAVNVYDDTTLIATGFFDAGKTTAAGISCFYHPQYKKYSLGKYLMFLKIQYCVKNGLQYFYPGYLVPGYAPFEYKSSIGKLSLEYLSLADNQWHSFTGFSPAKIPLQVMEEKLNQLQKIFVQYHLETTIQYYRFFDANLDPSCEGLLLFDYPLFLLYPAFGTEDTFYLVTFDVRTTQYHFMECYSVGKLNFTQPIPEIFCSDLLKVKAIICSFDNPETLAAIFLNVKPD